MRGDADSHSITLFALFFPQPALLIAAEMGLGLEFVEEKPWEWRVNSAAQSSGENTVLLDDPDITACGIDPILGIYRRDAGPCLRGPSLVAGGNCRAARSAAHDRMVQSQVPRRGSA